jgi:hypothetical protein
VSYITGPINFNGMQGCRALAGGRRDMREMVRKRDSKERIK